LQRSDDKILSWKTRRPGGSVSVPVGATHGFRNASSGWARCLFLLTPAALSCRAIMTYGRPYQFTTTTLLVTTAAGAQVAAMAHYWTTVEPEGGIASKQGVARIPFYISWSRPGYPVDVTVQVNQGTRSASCSTSFVPRWT
jgi:hypothetical protein